LKRLQRVPDVHHLTFLPTCSSTNPTPDGIPTAKSGRRIATQAPLDRAMSAPAPTQRWNRSTFDSGQAPSHGMTPVCSRSRMAAACAARGHRGRKPQPLLTGLYETGKSEREAALARHHAAVRPDGPRDLDLDEAQTI
jgi:hypothetical protein